MILITCDYFEHCILLQIITITDYNIPMSAHFFPKDRLLVFERTVLLRQVLSIKNVYLCLK